VADDNDISVTPVVASKPAPPPVATPTPVLGPLAKVMGSQKFVITALAIITCLVLWGMGRITIEQAGQFVAVILPAWLVAHGIQDRGK